MGSIIGALYPTPDELRSTEISAGLRLLICLAGGFAAFLWVLNGDGALNLLTPLWVVFLVVAVAVNFAPNKTINTNCARSYR